MTFRQQPHGLALLYLLRALGRLPLGFLYILAGAGYHITYHVAGYRRKTVRENLAGAFPARSGKELTVLEKNFYRQLTEVAAEIVAARYMSAREFRRRVTLVNPQLLATASDDGSRPVMILAIHQGNWEWLLHGVALATGCTLDPVYKPLHNRGADLFVNEVRARFGARPMARGSVAQAVLKNRDRARSAVLLADQSPVPGERCCAASFMGMPTAFHSGPAGLARSSGLPLLFARCRRRRRGYYEVEFQLLAREPARESEETLVQRYVAAAEAAIIAEPQSWLWSNRRWKRAPPAQKNRVSR
ncbi:MAG: lysophospholipid acyltransferase family protein [Halioglobus sp.]|nr:lysophospholipid acyltransferase family protein [Halioglobus sp.]